MEVAELFETSYFTLEFTTNNVLQIQAYLQALTMMLVGNEYQRLNVILKTNVLLETLIKPDLKITLFIPDQIHNHG